MRRALGVSAKVIGGMTMAIALFVIGVAATVLMLGLHDVYAGDTIVEHHSTYKEERTVDSAPRLADETVIEKRVEEKHTTVETVPAPKAQVIEERTKVETVPAPAVVEKRTTVETVPGAVIEKRTIEQRVEEN